MPEWKTFLSSGLIEAYCLGFTNEEETIQVELMAAIHPEIKAEVEQTSRYFSTAIKDTSIQPSPGIKHNIMRTIYRQEATVGNHYIPLMDELPTIADISKVLLENSCKPPAEPYENLWMFPLPSTREITNFAIWVKKGHDDEIHYDMHEYIAVVKGSCTMVWENKGKEDFVAGDIIYIPPGLYHQALVTSEAPMVGVVQRQLIIA